MPIVKTPDGKVVQFPDTMPEQEINAVLDKEYNPQPSPTKPWWVSPAKTAAETVGLVGGGALGATAGPVGAVAGAGLGYAGMKGIAEKGIDWLTSEKTPKENPWIKSGKDIVIGGAMEAGGQVLGPAISWLSGGVKNVDALIRKGIEKGIRPSVVGKGTYKLSEGYMEKAVNAVKTIAENRADLTLTDEVGNIVKGEMPKNLKQFSEAIDQMKGKVFSKYDAMTQGAGEATIPLENISKELDIISSSKAVIDNAPEVAKYAAERASALTERGAYTAQDAQDSIAILNKRLEAFNKNPSFENATKVQVDALVANHLRKGLDDAIENAIGPGYQELKNTYGALKAIEKDVNHRAIIDARRNMKGLIDFSDIFSGGQIVKGILSRQPATVVQGAIMKTIASAYRYLNSPNRIVQNMFEGVANQGQPRISEQTGKALGTMGLFTGGQALTQ